MVTPEANGATNGAAPGAPSSALYRMIWRWHFYAGLFVLPFVLILAATGSVYLFKPQIERWEERAFQGPAMAVPLPHERVEAALAAFPGASLLDYRLPRNTGDAAMVRLVPAGEQAVKQVFVGPQSSVLGTLDEESRIAAITKRIHSQLLIGTTGNRLVELVASWAIVMVLTGLYLWWPRGRGAAGVVWPRLNRGRRIFWRDLHAVTGFWISSLVLVLLATGLPWAGVWGSAFNTVRADMGWVNGPVQWNIDGTQPAAPGGGHEHHHQAQSAPMAGTDFEPTAFDRVVIHADVEGLAFPAIVTPPGAPGRFGMPGMDAWTVRSDTKDPTGRTTIRYDLTGRTEIARERFRDGHAIDQVVAYGIAWHEGQLFGWINQAIGVLTALGLVTLTVSGFVMWRRRRPAHGIGAPPAGRVPARIRGVAAILLLLALLLPMLAMSLIALLLVERVLLPRLPRLAAWLGVNTGRGAPA